MQKILHSIFDGIFPPRATELTVRSLTPLVTQSLYRPNVFNGIHYASSYQDARMKALIKENKYHEHQAATKLLALILSKWLETHLQEDVVLVPLPLGAKRQKERGYNQVSIILKNLPPRDTVVIDENLLRRHKETIAQTSLPKSDRLKNVNGAFIFSGQSMDTQKTYTIVLIDDVVTTGATLVAAKAALALHVPPSTKIICLAIAH